MSCYIIDKIGVLWLDGDVMLLKLVSWESSSSFRSSFYISIVNDEHGFVQLLTIVPSR